jgi:CDP-diacylglycerol---serine O-phosphatidyltransferase
MRLTGRKYRERGIYVIPNLLTTGNLFAGFYAVVAVFNGDFKMASIAILVATLFDGLDGKAARLTKTTSRFGMEYDSLCDVVSFGVAPGLLIHAWALNAFGRLGWIAAFLFVACGALRLARFNVQSATVESKMFTGLPIPGAAGLIAATVLLDEHILAMGREIRPIAILALTYVLAFLMVSNIRYHSSKEFDLRNRKPFNFLVAAVLILIVFAAAPQIMMFSFFAVYAASGPIEPSLKFLLTRRRRGESDPVPEKEVPNKS